MENERSPRQELNPKAILITMAVLILIPVVYVLFFKNDASTATPQPPALSPTEQKVSNGVTEANYIDLSLTYFTAKQYQQCIDASRKAIAINPKSIIAYNNICCAYNNLGQWDSAIVAGRAALLIDPNYQLAKNNLQWAIQMKEKGK